MNGHRFRAGILSILFILSVSSSGEVPQLINYQGRLLSGTNLANGTFGISLRLFSVPSGGSSLYEDSNSVAVADGLYSTFIGDHPTNNSFLTALTNAALYVEVAVNGTTLTPRERLASVGYSLATRGLLVTTNNIAVVNPAVNAVDPSSLLSTIGGGSGNSIQANIGPSMGVSGHSFLGGGEGNSIQINALWSVLGGGSQNIIQFAALLSFLGGGLQNSIQTGAIYSVLGGGSGNSIQTGASRSFLGGGSGNSIQSFAQNSVLGGGNGNSIQENAFYSFLGGGQINSIQAVATYSFLGGGRANSIGTNASFSALCGGSFNSIGNSAYNSFLGGGFMNSIQNNAYSSFLGGGEGNSIGTNAPYSTIPGGAFNAVGNDATNAFAAGYRAKANHVGTFVWADKQEADFASTANNQFLIRASGGVGIGTPSPGAQLTVVASTTNSGENTAHFSAPTIGANLSHIHWGTNGDWYIRSASSAGKVILQDSGGNVGIGTTSPTNKLEVAGNVTANGYFQTSDRNAKENFAAVDANDVLEKIAAMPISRWNFKTEPTVQHVGPMAQDFHAAFGLGQNDTTIATVDESGVALAAIQELVRQNKALEQRVEKLESERGRTE